MNWYDKKLPLPTRVISERVSNLSRSFANAQLGVSVDFEETDLKKAYRKAAMKVPDPAVQVLQFESSDEALASAIMARPCHCV